MGRYKRRYSRRQTNKDKLVFILLFGVISPIVSIVLGFFLVKYMIYPSIISNENNPVENAKEVNEATGEEQNVSDGNINSLSIFNIQTGSFNDLENAQALVESLKNKNVPAYVVKLDNYKVFSGTFFTKLDAEEFKQYLNQNIEEIFINENIVEGKNLSDGEVKNEDVKKISELINSFSEIYIEETTIWKKSLISMDSSKIKETMDGNNKILNDLYEQAGVENEIATKLKSILDSRKKISENMKKDNFLVNYSDYNKTLIEYINTIRKNEGD